MNCNSGCRMLILKAPSLALVRQSTDVKQRKLHGVGINTRAHMLENFAIFPYFSNTGEIFAYNHKC